MAKSRKQLSREIDAILRRKPSRTSTSLAAPSRTTAREPLAIVMDAVTTMPRSGRFGPDKVFISEIWQSVGRQVAPTLPAFKRWLLEQNRLRNLNLARADLVGAMDQKKVRESEIEDLGSTFHFVLDPTA